jgi:hypothetical protein
MLQWQCWGEGMRAGWGLHMLLLGKVRWRLQPTAPLFSFRGMASSSSGRVWAWLGLLGCAECAG